MHKPPPPLPSPPITTTSIPPPSPNPTASSAIHPPPTPTAPASTNPSSHPPKNTPALITGNNDAGPEPSKPGQVYEPGTLQRTSDYYIIVLHCPTESIARRDAKFIADNGVDVALEITLKGGKTWWMITSVKAYPSMVAADSDRKKIVAIGHLTKDFKLHHTAWDDAYVATLTPLKK